MQSIRYLFFIFVGLLFYGNPAFAGEPFVSCIERLKQQALEASISEQVVETVLARVEYSPRVIELDRKQPEFSKTFYNYYRQRVTADRVELGRKLLRTHSQLLRSLTRQYGIPAHYLVAFWGMETNFGRYLGKMNVLNSLATLACDQRRSEFFTTQLMDALWLVDAEHVRPEQMLGSWAGAMGNMQFMPSTYRQYSRDGDNNGKVDLWNSLDDAFTSAAYYLNQLGWQRNWRWGREVLLPAEFDYGLAGLPNARPLKEWADFGLVDVRKQPLPKLEESAALIVPAGYRGPAFLVYDNFRVIMKWNMSEFYALSVGVLADRINGAGRLTVPPPKTDDFNISEIKKTQEALNTLGYNAGPVDGIFGSQTKYALRQFQSENGLIADGFLHQNVLKMLKNKAEKNKNPALK